MTTNASDKIYWNNLLRIILFSFCFSVTYSIIHSIFFSNWDHFHLYESDTMLYNSSLNCIWKHKIFSKLSGFFFFFCTHSTLYCVLSYFKRPLLVIEIRHKATRQQYKAFGILTCNKIISPWTFFPAISAPFLGGVSFIFFRASLPLLLQTFPPKKSALIAG